MNLGLGGGGEKILKLQFVSKSVLLHGIITRSSHTDMIHMFKDSTLPRDPLIIVNIRTSTSQNDTEKTLFTTVELA